MQKLIKLLFIFVLLFSFSVSKPVSAESECNNEIQKLIEASLYEVKLIKYFEQQAENYPFFAGVYYMDVKKV